MLIAVAEKRLCTVIRTVAVAAVAAPPLTNIESEIQLTHTHSHTARTSHNKLLCREQQGDGTLASLLFLPFKRSFDCSQPTTQIHTILDIKFFQNVGQITRKRSHKFVTVPNITMFIQRRISCTWMWANMVYVYPKGMYLQFVD